MELTAWKGTGACVTSFLYVLFFWVDMVYNNDEFLYHDVSTFCRSKVMFLYVQESRNYISPALRNLAKRGSSSIFL
jgi:hypothetical protein